MTAHTASKRWLAEYILLAALWGASFLFMRLGAAEFGPLPTAGLRVTVAALFLLPLLLARGLWPELKQHWPRIFLLGMLNSGIPFALYSFAVLSISTGLSSLLNATVPLFGAVVAWAWLRDRPHTTKAAGLVIGFAGVVMLAWDKASFKPDASGVSSGLAVLACLGACLCYGISASYTKRYLTHLPSLVTATGSQIGAALGLATAVFVGALFYRGAVSIDLRKFFTWTGAALVVIAAGVLAYAVHELQEAGVLPGEDAKAFDLTSVIPPESWYGSLIKGIFNLSAAPSQLELLAWAAYLVPVMFLFLRSAKRPAHIHSNA